MTDIPPFDKAAHDLAEARRMLDFHKHQASIHRDNVSRFDAMVREHRDLADEADSRVRDAQATLDALTAPAKAD